MARKGVAKVNIAEVIDISERSETSIFVGKDILDLLSSSMYVNPLTIYRECLSAAPMGPFSAI